jgi:hypothetical protein
MKYTITTYGYGGELHIGGVDKKVWDYFNKYGNLGKYLRFDEDASDDIEKLLPREELHELDDCLHMFGPFYNNGTYLEVEDEDGDTIFNGSLCNDNGDEEEVNGFYEDEFDVFETPHDYVFVGLDIQRGVYNTYVLDTKNFDPAQLLVKFKHVTDNTDFDAYIIEEVMYNGKVLEATGDHDTHCKSADYRLYDIKNRKIITADDDQE